MNENNKQIINKIIYEIKILKKNLIKKFKFFFFLIKKKCNKNE